MQPAEVTKLTKSRKEKLYGCKTDLNLNNTYYSGCLSISSVKKWPPNAIWVSTAMLNLVSFSLLHQRGSEKLAKINITTFWLLPMNEEPLR